MMRMRRGFEKSNSAPNSENAEGSLEWEVRPCGMLVQKRDPSEDAVFAGPIIRVKVSYGHSHHYVNIQAHSTFGELKKLLVQDTGLQPSQQRLMYKGKERKDGHYLHEAGVKEKSKIVLVEDSTSWEKRLIEQRKSEAAAKAIKVVTEIQQTVDKLSGQVANVESAVTSGKKLPDTELTGLVDVLMCQLLKLEANKVEGDAKVQRTILIRRVQKYVEKLDALKLKNDRLTGRPSPMTATIPRDRIGVTRMENTATRVRMETPNNATNTVVTTQWENFGNNTGGFQNRASKPPVAEPLLIEWD